MGEKERGRKTEADRVKNERKRKEWEKLSKREAGKERDRKKDRATELNKVRFRKIKTG